MTRGQTLEDAEVGHRTTSLCHLAHISIQTGKKLQWDPAKERFTNSPEANAWVNKWITRRGTIRLLARFTRNYR